MKKKQIFISYRHGVAASYSQSIFERLTRLGYEVFLDSESIKGGLFNVQIYDTLKHCSDVVVVLPPDGLNRCVDEQDWVRRELAYSIQHNKRIVVIMMEGFEFPDELPEEIDIVRNYQAISPKESVVFPWAIQRLTSYLSCKPRNAGISQRKRERWERAGRNLATVAKCVLVALLVIPYIVQLFGMSLSAVPPVLYETFRAYAYVDLRLLTIIAAGCFFLWYMFETRADYDAVQRKNRFKNIYEDVFNLSMSDFIVGLLSLDNLSAIVKSTDKNDVKNPLFAEHIHFKGVEVASQNGEQVDYFYTQFTDLPHPQDLTVLDLSYIASKKQAVQILSKQDFVFCEENDNILHFKKDDMHIRLAYTDWSVMLLAVEVTRGDVASEIHEKAQNAQEESPVGQLKQLKDVGRLVLRLAMNWLAGQKKSTQWTVFAVVMAVCLLLLVQFANWVSSIPMVNELLERFGNFDVANKSIFPHRGA